MFFSMFFSMFLFDVFCENHSDHRFHSQPDKGKKSKPFWMRFRSSGNASSNGNANSSFMQKSSASTREAVSAWGVSEVTTWLESMQMGEYVETFSRNDIRGKELLTLTRRDLKELGITKVGHVKRIQQACKDLNTN